MKPQGWRLYERTRRCHEFSGLCVLWYMALLFGGVTMLARSTDGRYFMRLTGGSRLADRFRGIVFPGADSSLHVTGTQLFGASVIEFRKHVDCFSKSGSWIYDPTPRYIVPNLFSDGYAGQCQSRFQKEIPGAVDADKANQIVANGSANEWIVREELKWEWKSDERQCPLLPFNREAFCRMIGPQKNILFVGDSISQQMFWTLQNHLVLNRSEAVQGARQGRADRGWRTQGYEVCADVLGGPGQGFKVGFVRSDRLALVLFRVDDKPRNFYDLPWINLVEEWNVSVFILNRGAHFEDDGNVTQSLHNVFSVISSRWPTARVFYRSTPPGHINCTAHHEPLKERDSNETLSKSAPKHFHWQDFPRQNAIARRITERFGYSFLDLDPILALRPDGHAKATDCLHYCIPGPLDIFPSLLYNTLRLQSDGNMYVA